MKRRKFIILFGAGTTLPLVIGACNNSTNNTPTTTANTPTTPTTPTTSNTAVPNNTTTTAINNNFQTVCSVEQLNSKSMCLVEKTSMGDVLVVKDQANNLIAVNPKCTHKGCTVEWQAANQTFKCPCHDAQFSKDGSVINGPAKEPLGKYMAKIEGVSVLVKKTS